MVILKLQIIHKETKNDILSVTTNNAYTIMLSSNQIDATTVTISTWWQLGLRTDPKAQHSCCVCLSMIESKQQCVTNVGANGSNSELDYWISATSTSN